MKKIVRPVQSKDIATGERIKVENLSKPIKDLLGYKKKEPKFNLENVEIVDSKFSNNINKKNNISKRIIRASNEELQLHKKYLKLQLPKNYYN